MYATASPSRFKISEPSPPEPPPPPAPGLRERPRGGERLRPRMGLRERPRGGDRDRERRGLRLRLRLLDILGQGGVLFGAPR